MVLDATVPLYTEWNADSATPAYNKILDATDSEIVVFLHQDVFLPRGWEVVLARRIEEVESHDPNWAVMAAFGIDRHCRGVGPVWSSSLGTIVGRVAMHPTRVQSADELLPILWGRERPVQLAVTPSKPLVADSVADEKTEVVQNDNNQETVVLPETNLNQNQAVAQTENRNQVVQPPPSTPSVAREERTEVITPVEVQRPSSPTPLPTCQQPLGT